MTDVAYKLVAGPEWRAARVAGTYAGSALDRTDGYIHMSTTDQLAETARRHYAGQTDLVLVTVLLAVVEPGVKWEASRGGASFPHLYGPLPMDAVRLERGLSVGADGVMRFDDGAVGWP